MMTVPPDTYQISLNIIEAIKQHPVLYCTEVKGVPVKLQDFKQKVWKHISDELGLDRMFLYVISLLHILLTVVSYIIQCLFYKKVIFIEIGLFLYLKI